MPAVFLQHLAQQSAHWSAVDFAHCAAFGWVARGAGLGAGPEDDPLHASNAPISMALAMSFMIPLFRAQFVFIDQTKHRCAIDGCSARGFGDVAAGARE